MSSFLKRPVQRKHKPEKKFTQHTYRSALPLLLDDFENRCAYSLVHVNTISESEMHVDHFDPRLKSSCGYDNLYPAYGLCNEAKHATWPTDEQIAAGMRFLDPCKEVDYGGQIFEDPKTHELVATTPAADFHILILDLNNPALVSQRHERTLWRRLLNRPVFQKPTTLASDSELRLICKAAVEILNQKIPDIPPPPNAEAVSVVATA